MCSMGMVQCEPRIASCACESSDRDQSRCGAGTPGQRHVERQRPARPRGVRLGALPGAAHRLRLTLEAAGADALERVEDAVQELAGALPPLGSPVPPPLAPPPPRS